MQADAFNWFKGWLQPKKNSVRKFNEKMYTDFIYTK